MIVRKTVGTVGTLAHEAVSTAVSVAKHPIGSTALVAGFVKGAAGAGVHLVRSTVSGATVTPPSQTTGPAPAEPVADEAPLVTAEPETTPERDLPGPDIVAAEVPDFDDLPEPVVIEAEPAEVVGEAFHTEPKAASRDSEHGGPAGDREEAEGYVEEIPEPEEDTVVWTSESADGPLPGEPAPGEPAFDEAVAKSVRSEAEILQKAADQHVE